MKDKHFIGHHGFYWYNGVVEDRQDPLKLGRVRVRIIGHHTDNKVDLPTADLPWAMVMSSTSSPALSGFGLSPSFLLEGTWVFGYYRDGHLMQEPIILGTLPGKPSNYADSTKGFNDPNGVYPKYKEEVDTNRLAVNSKDSDGNEDNPHPSLVLRRETRVTGIPTADFNTVTAADGSLMDASDGDTFNQNEVPYAAVYPYNHVFESESGHLLEFDDTANNERIYLRHKTGSGIEISPTGTSTTITKGEEYNLVSDNSYTYIEGNKDVTINGRHKIYINKDGALNNHYDIQIGPNANINIQVDKGNINLVTVDGNINVNSGGDYNLKVGGNYTLAVEGNILESAQTQTTNVNGEVEINAGEVDINAVPINLN